VDSIFSRKSVTRDETELIILVSPELVHPMEAEEAPIILPGMDVTEPDNCQFFLHGDIEGDPHCDHRSTVYPQQCRRNLTSKHRERYQAAQTYYVNGDHGFSK
jgi:pilus assembly protein CpaC